MTHETTQLLRRDIRQRTGAPAYTNVSDPVVRRSSVSDSEHLASPRRLHRQQLACTSHQALPALRPVQTNRVSRRRGFLRRRTLARAIKEFAAIGAIGALALAIALPAFSNTPPSHAISVQSLAAAQAQSVTVSSEVVSDPLVRGTFSATTPEEIAEKKALEEQLRSVKAEGARLASLSRPSAGTAYSTSLVAPGSGAVRYPLPLGSYGVSRTVGGGHEGADMAGAAETPIFAAAAGTVRTSSESFGAYGVGVVIDSVVGGVNVSTLYAHMTYGTRQVEVGQYVEAGQLIGGMGNTGRSFGSHLHFEVRVDGQLVEPISWLAANAG